LAVLVGCPKNQTDGPSTAEAPVVVDDPVSISGPVEAPILIAPPLPADVTLAFGWEAFDKAHSTVMHKLDEVQGDARMPPIISTAERDITVMQAGEGLSIQRVDALENLFVALDGHLLGDSVDDALWRSLVGRWIGQTLVIGETVESVDAEGWAVQIIAQWRPCEPGAAPTSCVAITRTRTASDAALATDQEQTLTTLSETWTGPAPTIASSRWEVVELLLTGPNTLRPWSYSQRIRRSHAIAPAEGLRAPVFSHQDEMILTWDWTPEGEE